MLTGEISITNPYSEASFQIGGQGDEGKGISNFNDVIMELYGTVVWNPVLKKAA